MSLEKQLVGIHREIQKEKRLGDKRAEQFWNLIAGGGGGVPVGCVIPYLGGYFTNGANGGFTMVMATANTIVAVNTLLNPDGFYVCNGALLNLPASPIFNGAGRYLANITDDRFLMGDTLAGGIGGSNTMAHTHPSAYSIGNESAHTHAKGTIAAANESAHTHAKGTIATSNESAHTHGIAHTHARGTYYAPTHRHYKASFLTENESNLSAAGNLANAAPYKWHKHSIPAFYVDYSGNIDIAGTSAGSSAPDTGAGSAHNHSISGSTAAGSAHTHTLSGSTAAGSAHNHSISGNSGAASNSENRPTYLSCLYIMRVV